MEFEDIRLSEVSQAGEDVICSLTQEPKSQSQRDRGCNSCFGSREGSREERDGERVACGYSWV